MDKINCPICKGELLLVPDLNEMNKAIADHVKFHAEEMLCKKMPKSQILKQNDKLEDDLAKEVIIALGEKQSLSLTQ